METPSSFVNRTSRFSGIAEDGTLQLFTVDVIPGL